MTTCDISIIVPAYNESESIPELYRQIQDVLVVAGLTFEIIFVNDGSSDGTATVLDQMVRQDVGCIHAIHFQRNLGKAMALRVGLAAAKGSILITMDADLQDDPNEIPRFVRGIQAGDDLVSGWKIDRKDSFIKNFTSKIYNFVASLASGVNLHDHNCGFKAYRAQVAKALPLSGQLHRYIPMLVRASGFRNISEIAVNHRRRSYGTSKYGLSRFFYGISGLLDAVVISRRVNGGNGNRIGGRGGQEVSTPKREPPQPVDALVDG